jgi:hypothetical protein
MSDGMDNLHTITDEVVLLGALNAILHEQHDEATAEEVYWFVQRNSNSSTNSDIVINGINYYSESRAARSFLDSIICQDQGKDIHFYESVKFHPVILAKEMTYGEYIYNSDSYYANNGETKNGYKKASGQIYFSKSILTHICRSNPDNIIDLNFFKSDLGLNIEYISRKIHSENYVITNLSDFEEHIVKKTCRLSTHQIRTLWELFKGCSVKNK